MKRIRVKNLDVRKIIAGIEKTREREKKAEEEKLLKERKTRREKWIQNRIEAGFTKAQAEDLKKLFSRVARKDHKHWGGRIGPRY